MSRSGFTLVEVLAAVTVSAGLVIVGGGWLLGLQRSATSTRTACHRSDAVATTLVRFRDDCIHATPDEPLGARDSHGAWLLTVTGAGGAARSAVTWQLRDRSVIRAHRGLDGGAWTEEIIATDIDRCDLQIEPGKPPVIQVAAGTTVLTCGLMPGAAHGP